MPLKHLEHSGMEDFGDVLNRSAIRKKMRELKDQSDENKQERLEKRQKKYFNSENPLLWNGEI